MPKRIIEIDFLRGLAVIGMIVYHFFFVLNYYEFTSFDLIANGWLILARFVQISFLSLVGISLAISAQNNKNTKIKFIQKQIKRGLTVLAMAALVSITTYIFSSQYWVKFGILHLIGTSILLLFPLANKKNTPLVISILSFIISPFISEITSVHKILYPLGITIPNVSGAFDYFPIFPWIGLITLGIFLGNQFLCNKTQLNLLNSNNKITKFIVYFGERSLVTYMLHVPIIVLLVNAFIILTPSS